VALPRAVAGAQDRRIVSLGEVTTPLIRLPETGQEIGGGEIIVKDEGRLPDRSFKARGPGDGGIDGQGACIKHMAMPTQRQCRRGAPQPMRPAAASGPRSSSRRYAPR